MVDTRMDEKYFCMNIRDLLEDAVINGGGESELQKTLSDFSSPKNADVEHFLRANAIEFTKKSKSVTYLVFSAENTDLLGYFTITAKPVKVYSDQVSNTVKRKLDRLAKVNKDDNSYTVAGFLIAQLGKNYSKTVSEPIDGTDLMNFALRTLKDIQYRLGGLMVYLECEEKEALLAFYEKKNQFRRFAERMAENEQGELHKLVQLMNFL